MLVYPSAANLLFSRNCQCCCTYAMGSTYSWELAFVQASTLATGEAKPSLMTIAMQRWPLCGTGEGSLCCLSLWSAAAAQFGNAVPKLFIRITSLMGQTRTQGKSLQLPAWSTLCTVFIAINTVVLLFLGTVFEQAVHPSWGLHQSRLSLPRLPPVILSRAESKAWLKSHTASPLSTKLIELPRRKIKLVWHDFILTNTCWLVLISLFSSKCL